MILWWVAAAHGQTTLSLEEALTRSVGASEAVELSAAAAGRARGEQLRAWSGHLPTVSGSVTYDHLFLSEFSGIAEYAFESAPPPTDPSAAAEPEASPIEALFSAPDTLRVGLQANQPIFAGFRALAQDRIASAQRASAEAGLTSARATAALDVAQAYFDAALADRLLEIAESTLAQAEQTLANTALGRDVGRTAEFDLLRARVEAENQRVAAIRQSRARDNAHTRLRQLLDLPAETDLDLTTALDDSAPAASLAAEAADVGVGAVVAIRQSESALDISEQGLVVARSQWFPAVSASASYGWLALPGVIPADRWFPSFSAGLSLSVPIFSGGRIRGEVLSAQAGVNEAQTRLDQVTELSEAALRDAALGLSAAEAQWASTSGTVEQAERAYAIAEVRFREGVSTQTELADARLLLQQALANRAQAARDLQVARIRSALLPALPVVAGAFP